MPMGLLGILRCSLLKWMKTGTEAIESPFVGTLAILRINFSSFHHDLTYLAMMSIASNASEEGRI